MSRGSCPVALRERSPLGYTRLTVSAAQRTYDEIIDLFARGGGVEAVLAFRPSEASIARVRELLARNQDDALTDDERAELDRFVEVERLMQLVKARARQLSP